MSLSEIAHQKLGRRFGLFAVVFAIFIAIMTMLSHVGLPDAATTILFALVTLAAFVVIGVVARTMQLSDFQAASQSTPPVLNGMATAAAFLASGGFLGLAGAFFGGSETVLAIVAGWTVGFLALSMLVAPYFRRSAAVSVADFLAIRFASSAVRFLAVIVTLASSLAFLVAEITAAGLIAAHSFDIGVDTGIVLTLILIVSGSLLGGMRAVTLTAITQYIVLAIAFVAPIMVLSVQEYGIPVPQLTYGYALEAIAKLDGAATDIVSNRFLALVPLDGLNMTALALCIALGVASMPHIVMRSATSTSAGAARLSAGWALLFVLVIVATAPAYAAFTRLALLAGPSVDPVDADSIVLLLPAIANLSPAMSALIAIGAIAAILAAATALLFAIAQTIGHDFYGGILDRHGPSGRQLIVTRFFIIAIACLAGWYALRPIGDIFSLAATSLSLAASGLFPALFLGIWWQRTTSWGALAGMVIGFATAATYIGMVLYGDLTPWQSFENVWSTVPPMAAAIFGVPVGLLTIILVSLITPAPTPEKMKILEALRRPATTRNISE
jgi:cation/acetate symporter